MTAKKGSAQVIPVSMFSDGQESTWPGRPLYRPSSDENYLSTLGNALAQLRFPGKARGQYRLDRLPKGYGVFETDQAGGGPQVYKRLFGHPSGRYYDSIVKFQPHFTWLMGGMIGSCECHFCRGKRTIPTTSIRSTQNKTRSAATPRNVPGPILRHVNQFSNNSTRSNSATGIAGSRPQRSVQQPGAPYAHDEEGTEDVFKNCVRQLWNHKDSNKGIEIDIDEKRSLDWRAEHDDAQALPNHLTQIEHQHSFVPRLGELVLWMPEFLDSHYLMLDPQDDHYKFYSFKHERFHGFPAWRGGVVASVPSTSSQGDTVDFQDILDLPSKAASTNTSGFRIETFPDPNDDVNKSESKQYRYMPLRNIRPLAQWGSLLQGIPPPDWHPSIAAALTCLTSLSLVEKWRFNGQWPDAHIKCKGMYLGAELITVGDVVRFTDPTSEHCSNVLVVDSIRLHLIHIKDEHIRAQSPYLGSTSSLTLVGKAYTLDIWQHYAMPAKDKPDVALPSPISAETVKIEFRTVGAGEYGNWYPMHTPSQRYEVSYDQVIGRMYEADAVRLWTGQFQQKLKPNESMRARPKLDFDMSSIISGRKYATAMDERLPEQTEEGQVLWHWTDTRAEGLALATLNGLDVGKYHDIRDVQTLKSWNAQLRIIDGLPVTEETLKLAEPTSKRGRKPGSKVVDGKVVHPGEMGAGDDERPKSTSQMAGAALVSTDEEDFDDDDDGGDDKSSAADDAEVPDNETAREAELEQWKRPLTKQQIMASVEQDDILHDYHDSDQQDEEDDEAWLLDPVPLVRGGTEESEGGDYRPDD